MKKIIIFAISAIALFCLSSCNQELLNIQQKGVIAYEDFYKTDEDAQSAMTAAYTSFISIFSAQGSNNPAWNVVVNACGDELYWGGGKKDGSSSGAQDMNEFRNTYDSTIPHIRVVYKGLYSLIYKCNLVIDNFWGENGELCDSDVKKRCVAEARTLRAWAHFTAATFWGTPPLVEHVLAGDARPTNCDHQVLMDWCIKEFKEAIPNLETRKGPNDKVGTYKVTSGAAYAFLGKAQVFNKDWAGAKESLKKVIDSGNYALVPTSKIWEMFHMAGDGNEEKILEGNFVDNENISKYSFAQYHYQRNQALFLRNIKKYPSVLIQAGDGWGNNVSPTKPFMDAIMKHEPNSARRKAWFASYEEFVTDYPYPLGETTVDVPDANGKKSKKTFKADADMTKEEKLMDFRRGLNCEKYDETYANYGYYFMKFLPWQSDLIQNSTTVTQENRLVMRYAEVLLLYAEACAMGGDDGSGLKALNDVATRAGAPTYDALTMDNVKQEKWFELAWEGTRFWDLVRWGDAPKALAFKAHDKTPYLGDEFYVSGSKGKKTTGKPHKARINFIDDGWAAKGGGWASNKHELLPFPYDVIQLNPWNEEKGEGLKQNPGWE